MHRFGELYFSNVVVPVPTGFRSGRPGGRYVLGFLLLVYLYPSARAYCWIAPEYVRAPVPNVVGAMVRLLLLLRCLTDGAVPGGRL